MKTIYRFLSWLFAHLPGLWAGQQSFNFWMRTLDLVWGDTFEDEIIEVDGKKYVGCLFTNCEMIAGAKGDHAFINCTAKGRGFVCGKYTFGCTGIGCQGAAFYLPDKVRGLLSNCCAIGNTGSGFKM